jgi:hypothetical protein
VLEASSFFSHHQFAAPTLPSDNPSSYASSKQSNRNAPPDAYVLENYGSRIQIQCVSLAPLSPSPLSFLPGTLAFRDNAQRNLRKEGATMITLLILAAATWIGGAGLGV